MGRLVALWPSGFTFPNLVPGQVVAMPIKCQTQPLPLAGCPPNGQISATEENAARSSAAYLSILSLAPHHMVLQV